LKTLKQIYADAFNVKPNRWGLKFDIEGGEWELIPQIFNLDHMPEVICCEIHGLRWDPQTEANSYRLDLLSQLKTHYDILSVTGNNYSANLISRPAEIHDVIELTMSKKVQNDILVESITAQTGEIIIVNTPNDPLATSTRTRL
jgi:hypothetical protein